MAWVRLKWCRCRINCVYYYQKPILKEITIQQLEETKKQHDKAGIKTGFIYGIIHPEKRLQLEKIGYILQFTETENLYKITWP